jgi:dCMP deaminase
LLNIEAAKYVSHLEGKEKWDKRFLRLAEHISSWSKDKSTKVGAVIATGKNEVVSFGYNGFPPGVNDSDERYDDRETKLAYMIHAEPNAIIVSKRDLKGTRIYTWPFGPCHECAKHIIKSGISEIITLKGWPERWDYSFGLGKKMLEEAGVTYTEYDEI